MFCAYVLLIASPITIRWKIASAPRHDTFLWRDYVLNFSTKIPGETNDGTCWPNPIVERTGSRSSPALPRKPKLTTFYSSWSSAVYLQLNVRYIQVLDRSQRCGGKRSQLEAEDGEHNPLETRYHKYKSPELRPSTSPKVASIALSAPHKLINFASCQVFYNRIGTASIILISRMSRFTDDKNQPAFEIRLAHLLASLCFSYKND